MLIYVYIIKMAQHSLIQTVGCGWLSTIKSIDWGVVFQTCCQVFDSSLACRKYMYQFITLFRVEHKISIIIVPMTTWMFENRTKILGLHYCQVMHSLHLVSFIF